MSDIFSSNTINYSISIDPESINKNINKIILKQIKTEIECKCIKEGYVEKDSIKILSRSPGELLASHFNGNILYHLTLQLNVCNPLEGDIIRVKIRNINKMGILGESGEGDIPPISVLLARQHHIDNEFFNKLKVGKSIDVKIIGKRFEFGDNQINVIGVLENQQEIIIDDDDNSEIENNQNEQLDINITNPINRENEKSFLEVNETVVDLDNIKIDPSDKPETLEIDLGSMKTEELNPDSVQDLDMNPDILPNLELNIDDIPEAVPEAVSDAVPDAIPEAAPDATP